MTSSCQSELHQLRINEALIQRVSSELKMTADAVILSLLIAERVIERAKEKSLH